jgi:hypothetical protein
MQRLVEVVFRRSDIVVKFVGDWAPVSVDHPQSGVAGGDIWNDDANAAHIVDQVKGHPFAHHFAVDRVDVLGPSGDLCLDACCADQLGQTLVDPLHLVLAVTAALCQVGGDFLVLFGVDVAESQVFELPLDLPDTQAVCQGGEDIHRLLGNAFSLGGRHVPQGAHIVHAVCQLDQNHAHVVAHCHESFAQGFRDQVVVAAAHALGGFFFWVGNTAALGDNALFFFFKVGGNLLICPGDTRQLSQLSHPIDQPGDLIAKVALDILEGNICVLDGIVEQPGSYHRGRDAQLCQDSRNRHAVVDIRLS